MSLNSIAFLLGFLPLVVFVGTVVRDWRGPRAAQVLVLLASLAFYVFDGTRWLPLLVGSILFNWAVGRAIAASAGYALA